jgi:hypothetical protein
LPAWGGTGNLAGLVGAANIALDFTPGPAFNCNGSPSENCSGATNMSLTATLLP